MKDRLEKMKDRQQCNKMKAHSHHQLLAMPTTTLRILAKAHHRLLTHQPSNDCVCVGKLPLVLTFPITASHSMTNNSGASACLTFSNIKKSAKSNKSTKFTNEYKQKSSIPLVIV
jgi:hypothetical protein